MQQCETQKSTIIASDTNSLIDISTKWDFDFPARILPQIVVDDSLQALGKLAAWWRLQHQLTVIAVTGSNGKTTVKEMLRQIFAVKGEVLATAGNFNNGHHSEGLKILEKILESF